MTARASDPARYTSSSAVLDALVADGWIGGIRRNCDDRRTMQLISPRKMQIWAKTPPAQAKRVAAVTARAARDEKVPTF